MIVVDASAMVEALVGRDVDPELLESLSGEVAAPHLLDIEVLSVLRGLVLGHKLTLERADEARADHFDLEILRHDAAPLAARIWELRDQHTSYDATYLALAEAFDAPLHTCDRKLLGGRHGAIIRLHSRTH